MKRHQMGSVPRTVSTCVPNTSDGTHVFDIMGYSQIKGRGHEEYITSGTFLVGGFHWAIVLYPDSHRIILDDDDDNVTAFLELQSRGGGKAPPYLVDDRIILECVVTVKKEPRVSRAKPVPRIKVPPSNIIQQLGNLLESKEEADVIFDVAGETFTAHKLVLAMRSPVFKAEAKFVGLGEDVGNEGLGKLFHEVCIAGNTVP
ncbi:hypothetical protein E2562_032062 [Oryza meyeriana var. granulata]|uniref:BTB domain-containing protein n=1 Tax=Oryza meyeriana var. granulata TaxID=110450 RepID=A0A6G1CL21_9ORYZ|nr:hypothetical protein E2562_032062 [Oryza meyeriana var. granulata]